MGGLRRNGAVRPGRFPVSDHCDGTLFFNPHLARTDRSWRDLLRWRREARARVPWPHHVADPPQPPPPRAAPGEVLATFIGHATYHLQLGGLAFLADPIWSERASPLAWAGPRRVRRPGQALEALPGVDAVLVSHCHYDHLDLPTLRRLRALFSPHALTGLGNARHLAKAGLRAVELDWWEAAEVGGARVTYVPAQHFSARTLRDRNRALWGGFVIEAGGACVYFAGDSGYGPHFAEIGRRFPRLDLALLPIGAYEPRWFMRPQHVDPEEAVRAHLDLGARRSLAMHFGTFRLTDEAIGAPVEALQRALAAACVSPHDFAVLGFGETIRIPVRVEA